MAGDRLTIKAHNINTHTINPFVLGETNLSPPFPTFETRNKAVKLFKLEIARLLGGGGTTIFILQSVPGLAFLLAATAVDWRQRKGKCRGRAVVPWNKLV